MISAVGALVYPALGSLLAWTLYYPTHLFLKIAEWGSQLPGGTFAVGTLHPVQVVVLYGLILLVWRWPKLHRYWWLALAAGIALVAVPVGYSATNLSQVTVLATAERPVLVVQDQGKVGLIHGGNAKDAEFTVLPFLQKQGINQLDWAIAPRLKANELEGWQQIFAAKLPQSFLQQSWVCGTQAQTRLIRHCKLRSRLIRGRQWRWSLGQKVQVGSASVAIIHSKPDVLSMQFGEQTWLWFEGVLSVKQQADLIRQTQPVEGIGWSGKALHPKFLEHLRPKQAIAWGRAVDPATEQWLRQQQVEVHVMQQDGAVRLSTSTQAEAN